jgi:hypothetical protein
VAVLSVLLLYAGAYPRAGPLNERRPIVAEENEEAPVVPKRATKATPRADTLPLNEFVLRPELYCHRDNEPAISGRANDVNEWRIPTMKNKKQGPDLPAPTPNQAQRSLHANGSAFVSKFMNAYPAAIALRGKKPAVCWGVSGVVNFSVVNEFSGPTTMGGDAPLLFRVSVNLYPPPALYHSLKSPAVRQQLGVPTAFRIAEEPTLQLTALPEELEQFGTWVLAWYHDQSRHAPQAPKPPIPLLRLTSSGDLGDLSEDLVSAGSDWRFYTYLWTPRAFQLFSTWLEKDHD